MKVLTLGVVIGNWVCMWEGECVGGYLCQGSECSDIGREDVKLVVVCECSGTSEERKNWD